MQPFGVNSKTVQPFSFSGKRTQRLKQQAPTLSVALDRYVQEVSKKKRGGWKSDASLKRVWDKTILANRPISSITQTNLVQHRDRWLEEVAPATVVRRIAILSHLYTIAIKDWGMTYLQDPSKMLRKPIVENARDRRIISNINGFSCSNEVDWIINCTKSKTLPTVIQLALETAMRRGELVGIRREHIYFTDGYIHVPKSKNGKSRNVPLSPWAKYLLIDYLSMFNNREYLFGGTSEGGVTRAFIRARVKAREQYSQLCRDSGLAIRENLFADLHFHDLRHEATSRLAEIYEMHELAKITGHADTRMLLRYYHPSINHLTSKLVNSNLGQQQFSRINQSLLSKMK